MCTADNSRRTEKTYLNWTRQNLRYCAERQTGEVSAISSELVSNFLAYLAMQRKVSASTQSRHPQPLGHY
ncbi:MAG: phage integrase N-terminal SAM-like domain-containing protein [Desulfoprunum sp.]